MPNARVHLLGLGLLLVLQAGCPRSQGDGAKRAPDAGEPAPADPGQARAWEIKNPSHSNWPLDPVVRGRSSFVTYGDWPLQVSSDGKTWRPARSSPVDSKDFRAGAVVHGNEQFVALAGHSIFTSPDGSLWTKQTECADFTTGIAFGEGVYAVTGQGFAMVSRDGKTWRSAPLDRKVLLGSMVFGNGRFVATRMGEEEIWSSKDGLAWSKAKEVLKPQPGEDQSAIPLSVLFGNGRFLTVGRRNYQSTDGRTWTLIERQLGQYTRAFFVNGRFITFRSPANTHVVETSTDLSTWSSEPTGLPFGPEWLGHINGHYVTRYEKSYFSTFSRDLIQWSTPEMLTTQSLSDVAFGDGRFVAIGYKSTLLTSADGSSWAHGKKSTTNDLNGLAFGNHTFVVVGAAGTLLHSRDGQSWVQASTGLKDDLRSVCFDNGMFVVVSGSGAMLRSQDGKSWRAEGTVPTDSALVCGGGKYLAIGNVAAASVDGSHWESSLTGSARYQSSGFDGRRFLLETYDSQSRTVQLASEDGVLWRETRVGHIPDVDVLPDRKGDFELISRKLYWTSEGTTHSIRLPLGKYNTVCHGRGMFVGVGEEGAIATLRAKYDPERRPAVDTTPSGKVGPFKERWFFGNMEHDYIFVLRVSSDGEKLSGEYSYLGKKESLRVSGTIDAEGRFHAQEYSQAGQSTGGFDGRIIGTELLGEWSNFDQSRRLRIEGFEANRAQMEERLRAFKTARSALVGVYRVTMVYETTPDHDRYECALVKGRWACGSGEYWNSWQEPVEGREPRFGLKAVEAIGYEVKPDFTMELSVKGQKRWAVPLHENRMAYDKGAYFIAKGIRLRELETRVEKTPYTLSLDPEGNFQLDQQVYSGQRKVQLQLEKVR